MILQMMILRVVVFLFYLSLTSAANTSVTCLQCGDVASPSDCRDIMICGQGEICYTREFINHQGLRAFRLGCEGETRCNLFLSAQNIFGKRDALCLDPSAAGLCYACCKGDECNGRLCRGNGGAHFPQTPPTTTPCPICPKSTCPTTTSTTCPQTTCPTCTCPTTAHPASTGIPPFLVAYKDKYYFISSSMKESWGDAQKFCESLNANLVSINSQDEQEFIDQQLNKTGCTGSWYAWTGGSYSHSLRKFEWVDRSPVLYTHWYKEQPGTQAHNTDYHIIIWNPACLNSKDIKEGDWISYSSSNPLPFICEKQKI